MTDLDFWQAAFIAAIASGKDPAMANFVAETSLEHYLAIKEELERE